ncbi:hypothetical protein M9Y10_007822 [Tritrichomonas musculus]|uniref:Uncharacterized protein n=1 Tax=Tritrichomonas musculus TaxID=1915356 RepID=A0ABR2J2K8_9EUKA
MEIRKKNEEISSLEIQIEQTKKEKEEKILSLRRDFEKIEKDKEEKILSLRRDFEKIEKDKEEEISSLKKQILVSSRRYFRTEMSKEGPGILSKLKTKQKTPFDRLFVASQSSADIYTLLLPHSNDDFGTTEKSVREASELNGKYKDMTVRFAPVRGRKVRFIQTGPNLDQGDNFLNIKGIELLSTDTKYSGGVLHVCLKKLKGN